VYINKFSEFFIIITINKQMNIGHLIVNR